MYVYVCVCVYIYIYIYIYTHALKARHAGVRGRSKLATPALLRIHAGSWIKYEH